MSMTYTRTVSIGDDIIDPRDIIERVEELESETFWDEDNGLTETEHNEAYSEELEELAKWRALLDELSDPEDGEALILDSYFEDYARELAEDIGAVPIEYTWPISCIDWEQAADELRSDYSSVEINGYTYWQRA